MKNDSKCSMRIIMFITGGIYEIEMKEKLPRPSRAASEVFPTVLKRQVSGTPLSNCIFYSFEDDKDGNASFK